MKIDLTQLGTLHDIRNQRVLTGADWHRQVSAKRRLLIGLGIEPEDKVVIQHGDSAAFFTDLLAVWATGACAVCVNPGLTQHELHNICDFVEAALLLSAGEPAIETVPTQQIQLDDQLNQPSTLYKLDEQDTDTIATLDIEDDALLLILFTSGTTGAPKGVMHTGHSLGARIQLNQAKLPPTIIKNSLNILPTHFGHGLIGNCLTPLLSGATLFLLPSPTLPELATIGEFIDTHSITFMSSVPTLWKMLVKLDRPPVAGTLQQVNVGSAPLSATQWQAIIDWSGCQNVHNMYGITETANWVAGSSALEKAPEDGHVGTMWGGKAAVLTDDGSIADTGRGELLLRTPSIMAGYYRRQDLTDRVIIDGWFHTGDLGEISDGGHIKLLGRLKLEINRAGIKISPEEIDLLMEQHELVAEACAFAVPDDLSGERVAIAIVPESTDTSPELLTSLKDWCAARIRAECVPELWYLMDELPKSPQGKVNRSQVAAYCLNLPTRGATNQ